MRALAVHVTVLCACVECGAPLIDNQQCFAQESVQSIEEDRLKLSLLEGQVEILSESHDKVKAIKAAVQLSSAEFREKMVFSMHDGIAIRAAYEKTLHEHSQGEDSDAGSKAFDWFVGMLEGRRRIPLPKWWTERLQRKLEYVHDRKLYWIPGTSRQCDSEGVQIEAGDLSIDHMGHRLTFSGLGEWIESHKDEFKWFSVRVVEGNCIFTTFGDLGEDTYVRCVTSNGQRLWKTELVGVASWGGYAPWDNRPMEEVVIQGDRIVVFGFRDSTSFFEELDKKTGKSIVQFYSLYLWPGP